MTEDAALPGQLESLQWWLERPVLGPHEAACLLAGFLPPPSIEKRRDRSFGAWLPGRKPLDHALEMWADIVELDISRIESILRDAKDPHDQSPQAYLSLGAKRHFKPPWLDAARTHAGCLSLLPEELLTTPPAESPLQISNREKAQKRWEHDDKLVLMNGAGRDEFERLRAGGFEGCTGKSGSIIVIRVARVVLEAVRAAEPDPKFHPSPRTAERYVKKWLADHKSDNAGALSDNAGACVAK
ncbi:hypothetical protein ACM25N_04620 [Roseovarius sp. C7]|uniref:hypothetical protein n=1 Tax=Roseovarius sp. C7 TaxID=3398643 RepID=UPI0039F61789